MSSTKIWNEWPLLAPGVFFGFVEVLSVGAVLVLALGWVLPLAVVSVLGSLLAAWRFVGERAFALVVRDTTKAQGVALVVAKARLVGLGGPFVPVVMALVALTLVLVLGGSAGAEVLGAARVGALGWARVLALGQVLAMLEKSGSSVCSAGASAGVSSVRRSRIARALPRRMESAALWSQWRSMAPASPLQRAAWRLATMPKNDFAWGPGTPNTSNTSGRNTRPAAAQAPVYFSSLTRRA